MYFEDGSNEYVRVKKESYGKAYKRDSTQFTFVHAKFNVIMATMSSLTDMQLLKLMWIL